MATLFHLSPKTKTYSPCGAQPGNCPYGSGNHISAEGYALLQKDETFNRDQNNSENVTLRNSRSTKNESIQIAPEGLTGAYCYNCRKYFSKAFTTTLLEENQLPCEYCGEGVEPEGMGVDLRKQEARFLDDKTVRESSWFHVTTNDDWLNDMQDRGADYVEDTPLVHVGSREAALDRLRDMRKWQNDGSTWYLYELRLNPNTRINKGVFEDENDDCPSTAGDAKRTPYDGEGANRYMNTYEAPGTISLAINPYSMHEVNRLEVPLD